MNLQTITLDQISAGENIRKDITKESLSSLIESIGDDKMNELKAKIGDIIIIDNKIPMIIMVREDKIMIDSLYVRYAHKDLSLKTKEILGTIIVYPVVKELL